MSRKIYFNIFLIILMVIIFYILNNLLLCNYIKYYKKNIFEIYKNKKKILNKLDLTIIYFISINIDRNWKEIVNGQINDLNKHTILKNNFLKIVLCCTDNNILNESINYINKILNNIGITYYKIYSFHDNLYEYRGIKILYDSAKEDPNKIYLYMHSKGMYYIYDDITKKLNIRSITEKTILNETIKNFNNTLNLFKTDKDLMKVSLFPSDENFCWYNFYFVRGSYLVECDEPIIKNDRYYYESWLGLNKKKGKSYSLFSNNEDKYSSHGATKNIDLLSKNYSI